LCSGVSAVHVHTIEITMFSNDDGNDVMTAQNNDDVDEDYNGHVIT